MNKKYIDPIVSLMCCFLTAMFFPAPFANAEQIRDYDFPNITMLDGYPVYQIGDVAVYRVSPTFLADAVLQKNNHASTKKIIPKRSYEIKSNYIGTSVMVPDKNSSKKPTINAINLIDGDPDTGVSFLGTSAPSNEVAWCRIDLPYEIKIREVKLVAGKAGIWSIVPFPLDYDIRVSRDAWHWDGNWE